METIFALLVGAALGGTAIWFLRRPQGDGTLQALNADLQTRLAGEQAMTTAERAARGVAEQQAAAAVAEARAVRDEQARMSAKHREDLEGADRRRAADLEALKDTFAKQSQDALRQMSPDVTKEVASKVEPLIAKVGAALESYQRSLEQGMTGQSQSLAQVQEQMRRITETATALASSTNDFTMVLKSAAHRGRWGEETLRRVVEVSGLSPHCDFTEQSSQDDTRPDLIVNLPGNRCVIIDSKVPEFDVAIADTAAPNRKELVKGHATKLWNTVKSLAEKEYPAAQRRAGRTPFEHVILFLPAESLLSTALEGDPDLIIDAAKERILLATPATLIGFLGAISMTWQQHAQAEKVQEIADTASELHKRVCDFVENLADVRKYVNQAVGSLNTSLGSFERYVRPMETQLTKLGISSAKELPGEADLKQLPEMRELRRKGD